MALKSMSPFGSDQDSVRDLIMKKEGRKSTSHEDYEVLDCDEEKGDLKQLISAPIISNRASNLILDASALAQNEKEQKALEIRQSINDVLSGYNAKYGLDLEVDLGSLSRTLVNVADDKNRRVLELFVSKYFRSIKAILCLHLMNRLTLAIEWVTRPENLFNQSLSTADIFIVVEKLMQYIQDLQALQKEMTIDSEDVELRKIAEESLKNEIDLDSDESKSMVDDFMKLFQAEHK